MAKTGTRTRIGIDIHADTLCPWCYLQKKSLDEAMQQYKGQHPDVEFDVHWKPYYLYPALKEECDKQALYHKDLTPEALATRTGRLEAAGSRHGIAFSLSGRTGPSAASHRLIALAHGSGAQGRVVEALFRGHFQDGRDISDTDFLVGVGREAGLAKEDVREALGSERMEREVDDEVRRAAAVGGVKAVPCVTIQGRFRVGGYQDPTVFEGLFDKIGQGKSVA